jgi:hypothetical protein
MALELPPLPEFQPEWHTFQAWWQQIKQAIEQNEAAQQLLFDTIEETLGEAGTGIVGRVAILGSFTIPTLVITAADVGTTVTITIASHIRRYGDGTSLGVAGGSITGKAFSTKYAIYYDDDTRQDTSPSYQATTDLEEAQHNYVVGRHYVGTVTTPADGAASTTGGGPPAGSGYTAGAGAINIT